MGQNSSKRRSYTPGRGKNTGTSTLPRTNGEEANGGIEIVGNNDAGGFGGRESGVPISPTSATSGSPKSPSGKKDKRKRFRVGFSLKRTPSGRWSRKKKKPVENGTRPLSCPNPLMEEMHETPSRPHSLFLEELDVEDDNKIETVDLSDHEEDKSKTLSEEKSPLKAPERSKWKRGSQKKSSGKKKKKEKQTPKKDKKKKQKAGEDKPVVTSFPGKKEKALGAAPSAELVVSTQQKIEASSDELDGKFSLQSQEPDLEAIAASIVAETINIAQKRLQTESSVCRNSFSEELNTEPKRLEVNTCHPHDPMTESPVNQAPHEIVITASAEESEEPELVARTKQETFANFKDKSYETDLQQSVNGNIDGDLVSHEAAHVILVANDASESKATVRGLGNTETISGINVIADPQVTEYGLINTDTLLVGYDGTESQNTVHDLRMGNTDVDVVADLESPAVLHDWGHTDVILASNAGLESQAVVYDWKNTDVILASNAGLESQAVVHDLGNTHAVIGYDGTESQTTLHDLRMENTDIILASDAGLESQSNVHNLGNTDVILASNAGQESQAVVHHWENTDVILARNAGLESQSNVHNLENTDLILASNAGQEPQAVVHDLGNINMMLAGDGPKPQAIVHDLISTDLILACNNDNPEQQTINHDLKDIDIIFPGDNDFPKQQTILHNLAHTDVILTDNNEHFSAVANSCVINEKYKAFDTYDANEDAPLLTENAQELFVSSEDNNHDLVYTQPTGMQCDIHAPKLEVENQSQKPISDELEQSRAAEMAQICGVDIEESLHGQADSDILEAMESEAVAKKIVQQVIACALATVQRDQDTEEDTEVIEKHNSVYECQKSNDKLGSADTEKQEVESDFDKLGSADTEKQEVESDYDKLRLAEFEKKQEEKQRTEHWNEEEENEENDIKAEEKITLIYEKNSKKNRKDKTKGEPKLKVSQKLTNWFHKKEKQIKSVDKISNDATGTDEAAASNELVHPQEMLQACTAETMTCHKKSTITESQGYTSPNSVGGGLVLDVSVLPLATSASSPTETSPDSSAIVSPTSSSPTSPHSEAGDISFSSSYKGKKSGSGFIKKISLGPRLRTAILRKKSSDFADSQEQNKVSLTQPKIVESKDLASPSGKQPEESLSATFSVGNTLCSSDKSPQTPSDIDTFETSPQLELSEIQLTVDDSGIADLTSPEGNKSDFSCADESEIDIVEKDAKDVIQIASTLDTPLQEPFSAIFPSANEYSEISKASLINDDDEDDTRPLSPICKFETPFAASGKRSTSMDYFSPLESPKMISTATIILRSPSMDGRELPFGRSQAAETHHSLVELPQEARSKSERILHKENICSALFDSASNTPLREHHISRSTDLEHQKKEAVIPYTESFPVEKSTAEKTEVWNFLEHDVSYQQEHAASSVDNKDKKDYKEDQPRVKTVAEYQIGLAADAQGVLEAGTVKNCLVGVCEQSGISDGVKDNFGDTEMKASHADSCFYASGAKNVAEFITDDSVSKETSDVSWEIPNCEVLGDIPACDSYGKIFTGDMLGDIPSCDSYRNISTGNMLGNIPACDSFGNISTGDMCMDIPSCDSYGNIPACDSYGNIPSCDELQDIPTSNVSSKESLAQGSCEFQTQQNAAFTCQYSGTCDSVKESVILYNDKCHRSTNFSQAGISEDDSGDLICVGNNDSHFIISSDVSESCEKNGGTDNHTNNISSAEKAVNGHHIISSAEKSLENFSTYKVEPYANDVTSLKYKNGNGS